MAPSSFRGKLFQYESVKTLKNFVRPLKHALFGKDGVYQAMDELARLEGGADRVRVIFDVGAATGEYAVHFARRFPKADVYCFEPLPASYEKLCRRVRPYGKRVHTFPFGLYESEVIRDFHIVAYHDASSLLTREGMPAYEVKKIRLRTLDSVVAEERIQKIDFIKIDVEGVEKEILLGGKRSFAGAIDNAYIEIVPALKGFYSRDPLEVLSLMYDFGFGFEGVMGDFFFSKLLPKGHG